MLLIGKRMNGICLIFNLNSPIYPLGLLYDANFQWPLSVLLPILPKTTHSLAWQRMATWQGEQCPKFSTGRICDHGDFSLLYRRGGEIGNEKAGILGRQKRRERKGGYGWYKALYWLI